VSRLPLAIFALVAAFQAGCGGTLPSPPMTKHPQAAFLEVPYPPPAALVEMVGEPHPDDAVWLDGHWVWRGRYYVWQRGGWVRPPAGAEYASWVCVLTKDGRLMFAPGAWYGANRQTLPFPVAVVPAKAPPNQVTLETEAPR
jgi:hypothetical protein